MTAPAFTHAWDGTGEHCRPDQVIPAALASVNLDPPDDPESDDLDHEDPAEESAAEQQARLLEEAVGTCPQESISDALNHLLRARDSAADPDRLTEAVEELQWHERGMCGCAQDAWDQWCADVRQDLAALDETPNWAATRADRPHTAPLFADLCVDDLLDLFGHHDHGHAPARLDIGWDGAVLDVSYRLAAAAPTGTARMRPLTEDQAQLAAWYAADGAETDLPATHRAVAVPSPIATVAAALTRDAAGTAGQPMPWGSTQELVEKVTAVHDDLDEQDWATATAIAGRSWPGTPDQLRAATLAVRIPATLHH